ncbi:hypothetical protein [Actinacidiphila reveromycinica]|uniref:hypothetical protein n=1 Tax=Actinacidiphila reveromycinica TaxID=659352 RepID=UPI001923F323|nr:hypothetical protein [Streptomyces sp. SN-593]
MASRRANADVAADHAEYTRRMIALLLAGLRQDPATRKAAPAAPARPDGPPPGRDRT